MKTQPVEFLKESKTELKKASKPTVKELRVQYGTVLGFITLFSLLVFGVDTGLSAVAFSIF